MYINTVLYTVKLRSLYGCHPHHNKITLYCKHIIILSWLQATYIDIMHISVNHVALSSWISLSCCLVILHIFIMLPCHLAYLCQSCCLVILHIFIMLPCHFEHLCLSCCLVILHICVYLVALSCCISVSILSPCHLAYLCLSCCLFILHIFVASPHIRKQ